MQIFQSEIESLSEMNYYKILDSLEVGNNAILK